jgi:N-carbamoyl-L-amino-acid hydrolase
MGVTIGAVTHSHYSISADIECSGENGHISSLPMLRRRNALVGAARLIAEIDRIGRAAAPAGSASAVVIDAWPNNRINIPHRSVFSYGIIHPDAEGLEWMQAEIDAATRMVAEETGLGFATLVLRRRDPVHFTEDLIGEAEQAARDLGHSVTRMRTRPGHDAFNMLRVCPTELIFVPCRGGISHNELEYCLPDHVAAGADVLLGAILRRANR